MGHAVMVVDRVSIGIVVVTATNITMVIGIAEVMVMAISGINHVCVSIATQNVAIMVISSSIVIQTTNLIVDTDI
jgi:hypothetical protein